MLLFNLKQIIIIAKVKKMAHYQEAYLYLVSEVDQAITALRKALLACEAICIAEEERPSEQIIRMFLKQEQPVQDLLLQLCKAMELNSQIIPEDTYKKT